MDHHLGKVIALIGLVIFIIGIVVWLWGNKLNFLGRLPGDIVVRRDHFTLYFPITTMILLSIVVTVLVRVLSLIK